MIWQVVMIVWERYICFYKSRIKKTDGLEGV